MKVQELLKESQEAPKFDTSMLTKQAEAIGYRRARQIGEVVPKIENALRNGEVLSTVFDNIKYELNYFVENAFEQLIAKPYFHGKGGQTPDEVYWDIGYVHNVQDLKFYAKKLSKASDVAKAFEGYKDMVKFNEDFSPIVGLMQWLKDHKVSAAAKKKEAAEAKKEESDSWMKKYVGHKDVKKVIDILTELTKEKRDEIFKNEHEFLLRLADQIVKYFDENPGVRRSKAYDHFANNPMLSFLFSRMVDANTKLTNDWKDYIKKMAQEAADNIIDGFIYKNTGKIAYVIYKKNNMKSVKLDNVRIGQGKVECDLHFEFKDGSRFTATSSVVQASSKHGKWFYRYPTTFHNVILPGDKKMSSPSEQKMEEVFAVS